MSLYEGHQTNGCWAIDNGNAARDHASSVCMVQKTLERRVLGSIPTPLLSH